MCHVVLSAKQFLLTLLGVDFLRTEPLATALEAAIASLGGTFCIERVVACRYAAWLLLSLLLRGLRGVGVGHA